MRIVNFGSLNIDHVYSVDKFVKPGETKHVSKVSINCGGKGLNQSVALAKAGLEVYHAGFIGPDGDFLIDELEKYNIDTRFVKKCEKKSGSAIIQVDRQGQNCILIYKGTNVLFTDQFVDDVLSEFTPEDVVVIQNETNRIEYIIEKAASLGMSVAFNAAPFTDNIRKYPLELVKWLFVNEVEGEALTNKKDPYETVTDLKMRYPDTEIILTLGEYGCVWAGNDFIKYQPAYVVSVTDTTAAGDTFIGYFIKSYMDKNKNEEILKISSSASALAISKKGAAKAIPTYEEVIMSDIYRNPIEISSIKQFDNTINSIMRG